MIKMFLFFLPIHDTDLMEENLDTLLFLKIKPILCVRVSGQSLEIIHRSK